MSYTHVYNCILLCIHMYTVYTNVYTLYTMYTERCTHSAGPSCCSSSRSICSGELERQTWGLGSAKKNLKMPCVRKHTCILHTRDSSLLWCKLLQLMLRGLRRTLRRTWCFNNPEKPICECSKHLHTSAAHSGETGSLLR